MVVVRVVHLPNCTWRTFDAGQEDAALAHLKEHLSLVQGARDLCFLGVGKRGAGGRWGTIFAQRKPPRSSAARWDQRRGFGPEGGLGFKV